MKTQLVISLSAVPDIKALRVINKLDDLSDEGVLNASMHLHHQQHGHKVLPLYQQQIVSITAVKQTEASVIELHHFENNEADSAGILKQLATLVDENTCLVSWDMNAFDLPLLNYELLKRNVTGTDLVSLETMSLKDKLSNQQATASAGLVGLFGSLGLPQPTELGLMESIECYLAKQMQPVHEANQTRALSTYLLFLQYQCVTNALLADEYAANCDALRQILKHSENKTRQQFESNWLVA